LRSLERELRESLPHMRSTCLLVSESWCTLLDSTCLEHRLIRNCEEICPNPPALMNLRKHHPYLDKCYNLIIKERLMVIQEGRGVDKMLSIGSRGINGPWTDLPQVCQIEDHLVGRYAFEAQNRCEPREKIVPKPRQTRS
jgi:hypothetical protein